MKKQILISLFSLSSIIVSNAQWNGSYPIIWTNSNVGIGTSDPTGGLSIGTNHGSKLTIGRTDWSYKEILSTGYLGEPYFDYTDIKVASGDGYNNNSRLRILKNGNVGIMTEYPLGGLSIGTNHGPKITIGNPTWNNTSIVSTGYNDIVKDYIDIGVAAYTSNTALIRMILNGNVGIGTTTPEYKLDVVGIIRCHRVKINQLKTADFVFANDYKLPSLSEVETYINTHKHLKDIPSAEEMTRDGVEVGDLQGSLLQKIEELVLYTIQLKKENEEQKNQLDTQAMANENLQRQVLEMKKEMDEIKKMMRK